MFDLIFDASFSFHAIMLLMAGFVLVILGAAIFGYSIYNRLSAERYMARVIGVHTSTSSHGSQMFRAVYEFTAKSGETLQLPSSSSSNGFKNKYTGHQTEIMYKPGDNQVSASGSYLGIIIGLFFFLPGLWLLKEGLSSIEITPVSIVIFLLILGYIAVKAKKVIKPKNQRESIAQFKERKKQERKKEYGEIHKLEEILDTPTYKAKLEKQQEQTKFVAPIFLLCSLGLLFGAYHFGMETAYLTSKGSRTTGEIIRFEQEYSPSSDTSSSGYTYYPVFTFQTINGAEITTKSRIGSSHRSGRVGDTVNVLYDAKDPEGLAIVDYGLANWILPGALGGMGIVFLLISLSTLRNRQTNRI